MCVYVYVCVHVKTHREKKERDENQMMARETDANARERERGIGRSAGEIRMRYAADFGDCVVILACVCVYIWRFRVPEIFIEF